MSSKYSKTDLLLGSTLTPTAVFGREEPLEGEVRELFLLQHYIYNFIRLKGSVHNKQTIHK